jgi:hypothetical protein
LLSKKRPVKIKPHSKPKVFKKAEKNVFEVDAVIKRKYKSK